MIMNPSNEVTERAAELRLAFLGAMIARATGIGEDYLFFKRGPADEQSPLKMLATELANIATPTVPAIPRTSAEAVGVGATMANVLFNFAQKTGYTLTSDDTALFDKLRKEWDAARATPAPADSAAERDAAQRLLKAAKTYAEHYVQDEADPGCGPDDLVCSVEQHEHAKELFVAIEAIAAMQPKGGAEP